MPISVLLVDDVPDVRTLLRLACKRHGGLEVVGEAKDGNEAVELADTLQPDVIVLDIAMPELDGLSAIPQLHEVAPKSRILVLSGFAGGLVAEKAIELCAMGYVEKGRPAEEIMQAVKSVHAAPPKAGC